MHRLTADAIESKKQTSMDNSSAGRRNCTVFTDDELVHYLLEREDLIVLGEVAACQLERGSFGMHAIVKQGIIVVFAQAVERQN